MKRWTIYDHVSKFFLSLLIIVGVGSFASVLIMLGMLWQRGVTESTPIILEFIIDFAIRAFIGCSAMYALWALCFVATSILHLWPFRRTLCLRLRREFMALPTVHLTVRAIAR